MMSVSRTAHFLAIVLVASLAANATEMMPGDATLLRLRLQKNMTFRYDAETTTSQQMSVMGQDMTNDISYSVRISMAVADATLDRSSITCTFSDAKTSVSVQGVDENVPGMDTSMSLTQFDGATMTMTLDPTAKIVSVDRGSNSEASSLFSSMRIMERINTVFPVKEVRIGDSWIRTVTDTVAAGQGDGHIYTTMTLKNTYRGIRDTMGIRCWLIETESSSFDQHGTISTNGIDMDVDGSGTFRSRCYVEEKTGMTVITLGDVTSDTRMSLSGQQEMIIPVDTHLTFTVKRRTEKK